MLLPIVDRELRVASRHWRTYLARVTTGIAALGIALYLIWMARYALGGPTAGMFILKATSYMAWALCIFGGVSRACDALSSEKRGETLGLLFLTHLKGYDVVLGKLLASGLSAAFLLIGVLPILSIPVLLGGVTGSEMIRIPISLMNALLLALSIGLIVSSLARSQRVASSVAGGVVVVFTVALPVLANLAEREWQSPELAQLFRTSQPPLDAGMGVYIGVRTEHERFLEIDCGANRNERRGTDQHLFDHPELVENTGNGGRVWLE